MGAKLAIGVNGGHLRSTAVAIFLESGKIAGKVNGNCLNPHSVDESELFCRAENLASELIDEIRLSHSITCEDIESIVISLPGVGLQREQDEASVVMRRAFGSKHVKVVDDTWAALFAVTQSAFGICAFAGCGASVCIALGEFIPKKEYKIDGWGPVIGDFGSGFQLVTRFFRNLGRELDEKGNSEFYDEIRTYSRAMNLYPELPALEFVQEWFDSFLDYHSAEWRAQFARLAEPVIKIADSTKNDTASTQARDLVNSVAAELALSLRIAVRRHPQIVSQGLPLVLQGGVLRNSCFYQSAIKAQLSETFSDIIVAKERPVIGALMMATEGLLSPEAIHGIRNVSGA